MSDPLARLEERIGYSFGDRGLLERAVTHPSWVQNQPGPVESNQRLEFLGDAVLQLVLTQALFELYPADREGVLTRRRAALANGTCQAALAREIGLDLALRLGPSEESTGGRQRPAALEDALEALIGAAYLDRGLSAAATVVLKIYGPLADRLRGFEDVGNPKGRLQELIQPTHGNSALRYEVTRIEGEDHAREFHVTAFLLDRALGSGSGSSKKAAEEEAARATLLILGPEPAPGAA